MFAATAAKTWLPVPVCLHKGLAILHALFIGSDSARKRQTADRLSTGGLLAAISRD